VAAAPGSIEVEIAPSSMLHTECGCRELFPRMPRGALHASGEHATGSTSPATLAGSRATAAGLARRGRSPTDPIARSTYHLTEVIVARRPLVMFNVATAPTATLSDARNRAACCSPTAATS